MKAITVTVLIQNLQKIKGLATKLINEQNPDVMLAQEINLNSESDSDFHTHNTSSLGFGTAIWSKMPITNIKLVESPYAEFGGIIYKKTTIASTKGITFLSFHGYNGTPFKSVDKLVAHVQAVLLIMSTDNGPAVFAGDFNSWTQSHLDAVKNLLEGAGFALKYSWPYPGRTFPLDHAFVRGVTLIKSKHFPSASDHNGALLELELHA
jgi:endonuclease/exonuclease/phosphatase (EEP) superfamily protein YafD